MCYGASGITGDKCFLLCAICSTPEFSNGFTTNTYQSVCNDIIFDSGRWADPQVVGHFVAEAFYNASLLQGNFWLDGPGQPEEYAMKALTHLFAHMSRKDTMAIFGRPLDGMDFLIEHVRFALIAFNGILSNQKISWQVFADNVLPFSVWNEKRDLGFRWRSRFAQLFGGSWINATNIYAAMEHLVAIIPTAASIGVLSLNVESNTPDQYNMLVPGSPIAWRSESSPGWISPEQVQMFGGSCTGTAIVLVAAARAIGIPARIAGCSQSVVTNDDHHWIEFYDCASGLGPFGDCWHTKEGVSKGNEGGPWDSPSAPMLGCLQGVIPGSRINTIWAQQYSSHVFMPALWTSGGRNGVMQNAWAFSGGENRCGVYCAAWGCGVNNSDKWNQTQCGPTGDDIPGRPLSE